MGQAVGRQGGAEYRVAYLDLDAPSLEFGLRRAREHGDVELLALEDGVQNMLACILFTS